MAENEQTIFHLLKQSRYFRNISEEMLERLLLLTTHKYFKKGECVLLQGETNQEVYVLLQGTASVKVEGKLIYYLTRKGDVFGEMSVITGEPSNATIEAYDSLEVITLSSALLQTIQLESSHDLHHFFYQWFSQMLSDKLKHTTEKATLYEDLSVELKRQKEKLEQEIETRERTGKAVLESYKTIKQQQVETMQQLNQARDTQKLLLPEKIPEIPGVRIACKYDPMHQIGGDFYDVFALGNNKFGLMVADVTGHGISAALISFMVSIVFKNSLMETLSPQQVLWNSNHSLHRKLPDDKFATMFYAIYDSVTGNLTYALAGHPPALVIRASSKEVFRLNGEGMVMGMFPSNSAGYYEQHFQIEPGDKALFYTDGIYEVMNEQNQMLTLKGMERFLAKHCDLPIEQLLDQLYEFGLSYSNERGFDDDITLVGLEVLEDTN